MARHARRAGAVFAVFLAASGLLACVPATPPSAIGTASATPPVGTPRSSPSTESSEPGTTGWTRYEHDDGRVSFDLPVGWTVRVAPSPTPAMPDWDPTMLTLVDPAGAERLTYLDDIQGTGGACEGSYPYETLESQEIGVPVGEREGTTDRDVSPRVAYRAVVYPDQVVASLGTTDSLAGRDGRNTCFFYNTIYTEAAGTMSFADALQVDIYARPPLLTFRTMDEARAYIESEDFRTLWRILTSLEITPATD